MYFQDKNALKVHVYDIFVLKEAYKHVLSGQKCPKSTRL